MFDYIKNNKLGAFTMFLALAFIFLGMPGQILKIWGTKSVANIAIGMFILQGAQAVSWIFYGFQKKDRALWLPNIFVAFFMIVLFIEWWMFR